MRPLRVACSIMLSRSPLGATQTSTTKLRPASIKFGATTEKSALAGADSADRCGTGTDIKALASRHVSRGGAGTGGGTLTIRVAAWLSTLESTVGSFQPRLLGDTAAPSEAESADRFGTGIRAVDSVHAPGDDGTLATPLEAWNSTLACTVLSVQAKLLGEPP